MSQLARRVAQLVFGHPNLARGLEKSSFVQAVAHRLRLREWINAALARFPLRRHLPVSGVKYRIENFETLVVEREYFCRPIYQSIFAPVPPTTFIDLGCNSGIFPCLLAHLSHGAAPRGLCIDANAAQVELTQRNMGLNGWNEVQVRWGLVGNGQGGQGSEADFFLHPTSLGSSQFAYADSESGRTPDWKRISVPVLHVTSLWDDLFGRETRCGCLKIDIEGSEMIFLRQETSLLDRTDAILLEWHSWATTREEVLGYLAQHGFRLECTVEDTPRHGVLYFRRS